MKVAAHAHGAAGIKAAIWAGIDTIEHASLVDDEGIKLALQRKQPVWFVMDIFNTDYTQAEDAKNGMLADNLRKDHDIAEIQRNNFRKAHAAGVRIAFGTDAGVMPHGTAAGQFKVMVDHGMTPIKAIRTAPHRTAPHRTATATATATATVNAAQALGREQDFGAIAVGRYGDLVAVVGDLLSDVTLLTRVTDVIRGGVRVGD